VVARTLPLKIR